VNYSTNIEVYALQSTSLKDRDWKALLELFDREDADDIEADIHSNLLMLVPEPCWDDDPFDFLSEYL
jgi:hypothetical protein